ncbi:unnamed protein product [Effrenium voratum]|nr:unnamed protein product [Effrenium voratum]
MDDLENLGALAHTSALYDIGETALQPDENDTLVITMWLRLGWCRKQGCIHSLNSNGVNVPKIKAMDLLQVNGDVETFITLWSSRRRRDLANDETFHSIMKMTRGSIERIKVHALYVFGGVFGEGPEGPMQYGWTSINVYLERTSLGRDEVSSAWSFNPSPNGTKLGSLCPTG